LFNRGYARKSFLVRECCFAVDAPQAQHAGANLQWLAVEKRVLFEVFTFKLSANRRQTFQHRMALPFGESKFFLDFDHVCLAQRMASGIEARLPYINIPTR